MKSLLLTAVSVAGLVLAAGAARADDVRVIVGFKGDASTALVRANGGRVHRTSGQFVAASLPAKALAALRANEDVAYVEEDGVAEVLGKVEETAKPGGGSTSDPVQSTPWGITRTKVSQAASKGAGIRVAVIDTGIDWDHKDLAANYKGGVDYVQDDGNPDDDNGHGSHVAGTIAAVDNTIGVIGMAPQAHLYAVKVLDRRGSGWLSDVAAGIDWAANKDNVQAFGAMQVANMSLGARSGDSTLKAACDNAKTAGVLLVAAAGNSGDGSASTTEISYPAAYPSCVAVGATTSASDDKIASFSNSGYYVQLSAPGAGVLSTYKGGGYATLSGTSMASPHVAGMAAVIWSSSVTSTRASVLTTLQSKVVLRGAPGPDVEYGYGRIDWAGAEDWTGTVWPVYP